MRTRILVCFAVPEEARGFGAAVARRTDVRVLITGVGRQNAERALRAALADSTPELVVTSGFAGGLDPALCFGEIVFNADAPAALREKLLACGARPVGWHCSDRIVATAAEKRRLRVATGADAVEMESAAIHAICRAAGIPCLTVRVILDRADEDLPLDFNRFFGPDQKLHLGRLLLAVAAAPRKIPALLRMARASRRAAANLSRALVAVTAAGPNPTPAQPATGS